MSRLHSGQMKRNKFSLDCKCFFDRCVTWIVCFRLKGVLVCTNKFYGRNGTVNLRLRSIESWNMPNYHIEIKVLSKTVGCFTKIFLVNFTATTGWTHWKFVNGYLFPLVLFLSQGISSFRSTGGQGSELNNNLFPPCKVLLMNFCKHWSRHNINNTSDNNNDSCNTCNNNGCNNPNPNNNTPSEA